MNTLKPISLKDHHPSARDGDASGDVLWFEAIDAGNGNAPLLIAWSGPWDGPEVGTHDQCSGLATHWLPLSVFVL